MERIARLERERRARAQLTVQGVEIQSAGQVVAPSSPPKV
jgi:hypothetical protein